jgi:pimeloyl-ACP methyl ester carboxylesterase
VPSVARRASTLEEIELPTSSGTLHALATSTDAPEVALLIHGFPDSPHGFARLAKLLSRSGVGSVIPYLPGYKPNAPDEEADVAKAASVIAEAMSRLSREKRLHLVGHDWGALIAYELSHRLSPASTTGISVPPPALVASLMVWPAQLKASWYMFFFQLPVAEAVMEADLRRFLQALYKDWSPSLSSSRLVRAAMECLAGPEHLRSALSYYRKAISQGALAQLHPLPSGPFLYVHGSRDGCLLPEGIRRIRGMFPPEARVSLISGAGHFVPAEQPERLARLLLSYWAQRSRARRHS